MLVERSEWMTYVTHLLANTVGKPQDGSNFNGNDVNGSKISSCVHTNVLMIRLPPFVISHWITEI